MLYYIKYLILLTYLCVCVCVFQASLNCNFAEPPKPSYKNYR